MANAMAILLPPAKPIHNSEDGIVAIASYGESNDEVHRDAFPRFSVVSRTGRTPLCQNGRPPTMRHCFKCLPSFTDISLTSIFQRVLKKYFSLVGLNDVAKGKEIMESE